ncbi:phosphatidylserine decarboxylase family protein [Natronoflexus pectinivorans]|uniref:Phosphatidylserine decarboxylase proenzyme n=1 Tax=Natronoflexus pectinivorans TaxID=682526 RepID=A0A4R2GMQ4_9BACT|nr:phosphatidylserine decarboxylase family protein [Natronoflexus pectinivorans]TCO10574.1 phosphatidylserine decarboxylase [Natronoflexus pectinivorans]
MTIHKEGFKILGVTFLGLAAINILLAFIPGSPAQTLKWSVPVSLVVFFFVVNFFRSPRREGYYHENAIIAPADGKIVVVEETEENEIIKGKAIQVSIFMNVFNVHINWFPINGKIKTAVHHSGRFMSAYLPKASTENERTTVAIEHENGSTLVVRQIAGAIARRIVCYAKSENTIKQGDQMGFIKFGSRVDIYLPPGTRIDVRPGQKVVGKQTILGWLE